MELFAGEANVSQMCRAAGLRGVSCDVLYGGRAMDLTTPAGMACTAKRINAPIFLRLALTCCLRLQPASLGILAPVCSSMGFLTASQTMRSFMIPLGQSKFEMVRTGNLLAIRQLG